MFLFLFAQIYRNDFTGSHGTLLGVINAFVHVIMYSYYFLTSYRPELKDSLWWKKHITQIQLVSEKRAAEVVHSFSKYNQLWQSFIQIVLAIKSFLLICRYNSAFW